MRVSFLVIAMIAALLSTSHIARADIVAPVASCKKPGDACNTGGPKFDQAGTCVASTCENKMMGGPDGSFTVIPYACTVCSASPPAAPSASSSSSGSGCSFSGARVSTPDEICVPLSAVLFFAVRRRRSRIAR